MADDRQLHLLFHGIGTPSRALEPGEDEFWVGFDQFRRILDEAMTWPGVVFSFDDGNLSDVEFGLPALRERGLEARFNVIAGRLGEPGSSARPRCAPSWTPVCRWARTGWCTGRGAGWMTPRHTKSW